MKIRKAHFKTQAEAKERLINLANDMGMQLSWVDDQSATGSLSMNGVTITGVARITESHCELDVALPRLARMFSGRIEKEIDKRMGDALQ